MCSHKCTSLASWICLANFYKQHFGSKSVSPHDLVSLCPQCKNTGVLQVHTPSFPTLNTPSAFFTGQRTVTNFLPEPTNISAELDYRAN